MVGRQIDHRIKYESAGLDDGAERLGRHPNIGSRSARRVQDGGLFARAAMPIDHGEAPFRFQRRRNSARQCRLIGDAWKVFAIKA